MIVYPKPMCTYDWYKFENDAVERILSCTCTVFCYILEYIYIGQIAKGRTSDFLCYFLKYISKALHG